MNILTVRSHSDDPTKLYLSITNKDSQVLHWRIKCTDPEFELDKLFDLKSSTRIESEWICYLNMKSTKLFSDFSEQLEGVGVYGVLETDENIKTNILTLNEIRYFIDSIMGRTI